MEIKLLDSRNFTHQCIRAQNTPNLWGTHASLSSTVFTCYLCDRWATAARWTDVIWLWSDASSSGFKRARVKRGGNADVENEVVASIAVMLQWIHVRASRILFVFPTLELHSLYDRSARGRDAAFTRRPQSRAQSITGSRSK